MKKYIMVAALLPFLVIAFAGGLHAGQREMDQYGLLHDETTFITNPLHIAQGEEIWFYDDYRFTYTGVTGWVYCLDQFNTVGNGERKNPADNVLKLLQTDKARIEWSTDGGLSVLFDI